MSKSKKTPDPSWHPVKFGDVVRHCKESVDRDNNPFERYVEGGHMDSERLQIRRWGEFGDDYVGPAFHRIFRKGQVLYGSRRTYLKKVAVADFDGITANTTFVCETKDQKVFLQELLPFLMLTEAFTRHSIKESKGSTNPYINWPDIAKFEFLLPPVEDQKRIANILLAADQLIESLRTVISNAKVAQPNVFENLLKQDRQNVSTLGQAIDDIIAGKSPMGASRPADANEYGVLKVSAIGDDGYVEVENKALLDPNDFRPEYEVKQGFILVTRANALPSGVGRPCMVTETRPRLMLSDKTLRLVPNTKVVRERFLLQNLFTRAYRRYVESAAGGTEAKNISQERLKKAPIWLPSTDVQKEVEKMLFVFDHTVESAENHLEQSVLLFRSLNENWKGLIDV